MNEQHFQTNNIEQSPQKNYLQQQRYLMLRTRKDGKCTERLAGTSDNYAGSKIYDLKSCIKKVKISSPIQYFSK